MTLIKNIPIRLVVMWLLVMSATGGMAQHNLVKNYSFEDHTACPYTRNQIHFAKGWYNPCNGGTDYFHACSYGLSNWWTPYNAGGYQVPHTGVALAGIYLFYGPEYREYIGSSLVIELEAMHWYHLTFFVSLVNGSRYATDLLGACVLKDTCICDHTTIPIQHLLEYTPQVCNPKGRVLSDTLAWMEVSGTFRAEGGEKFLIIGDFYRDEDNTLVMVGDPNLYPICGYLVDDVSLVEVDSVNRIPDTRRAFRTHVSPNPSSDHTWLYFTEALPGEAVFELFSLTGGLVRKEIIPAGTLKYEVPMSGLAGGLYGYRISGPGSVSQSGKLVINSGK